MKKVLLIGLAGLALAVVLCAGLVFAVVATPLRTQVERVLAQVFDRQPSRIRIDSNRLGNGEETPQETGILIARVVPNSPAEKAGLKRGDILLSVDGQTVNSLSDLQNILKDHQAGDEVKLLVQRGDAQQTLTAALDEAAAGSAYLGIQPGSARIMGEPNAPRTELQLEAGARISEVTDGSPALKAGLKAGETIVSVDGEALSAGQDLADIITNHKPGDTVSLEVKDASGETREVAVTLGENPDKAGNAWLGIRYEAAMPQRTGRMPAFPNLPRDGSEATPQPGVPFPHERMQTGALIQEVVAGSPAEKAGLKAGQILTAVDGKTLQSAEDLTGALASLAPGDATTIKVFDPQAGDTADVKVTLGENPNKAGAAWLGISFSFINIDNSQPQNQPGG